MAIAFDALNGADSRRGANLGASIETVLNGDIDPAKLFGVGLIAQRDPNRWLNDRAYHGHHHTHGISAFFVSGRPAARLARVSPLAR